jgi:hypothetical protein
MQHEQTGAVLDRAMEEGRGILRLAPAWVPRSFCRPGRRIRLHPDDYYALGLQRGAIDERWLSSTTHADNGPGTPEDEGLSYVVDATGNRALLTEAVGRFKGTLIGKAVYDRFGGWPMFSKFFDNLGPLPHHIHLDEEAAARVNAQPKPEMYFFPSQMNNHGGEFPYTFFGLTPGTTREQVQACLRGFEKGDNGITALSRAYRLVLDTGWDVPPGILHAPGSLCTYEPQYASDVLSMFQSVLLGEHVVDSSLLWKDVPPEQHGDVDALISLLDWDKNVDPDFFKNRFMPPLPVRPETEMEEQGYREEWIGYRCPVVTAKRLTLFPGTQVTLREPVAYGFIAIQGHGRAGVHVVETPPLIRYGALTRDEYFVSAEAAAAGVTYANTSDSEPLVLLMHTAVHPDRPQSAG